MDGLARFEIIVERHFPLFGEVDELIKNDEIAAPDFLPEGTVAVVARMCVHPASLSAWMLAR